jgi:hypothetical protein
MFIYLYVRMARRDYEEFFNNQDIFSKIFDKVSGSTFYNNAMQE